jgi:ceramide glucosyltransferase
MLALFRQYVWLLLIAPPLAYYLLVLYAVFQFRRERRSWPGNYTPPISVLKPVGGLEHGTYDNFASFCRQDYPLYEILFCVNDESDSAVPLIEKLIRDFPERSIRLLIGRDHRGLNPKADKLIRLVREAQYDLFVTSDSDVRVGPNYLRSVAAPFSDPAVGVVSTFFQGKAEDGFVGRTQALSYVADFWTHGMVSHLIEDGFKWGTGATVAMPRELLAMIGGYESIVDYHSDDFRITQALTSRGYRVEFASEPIQMVYPPQSFRSFVQHQILWSFRLRRLRPAGHFGLLFTFGLPWAILAGILSGSAVTGAAVLAGYFVLRAAAILAIGLGVLRDPQVRRAWFLFPVCDALGFCVWLVSFFKNRVHWRGREYLIEAGGRLTLPPTSD